MLIPLRLSPRAASLVLALMFTSPAANPSDHSVRTRVFAAGAGTESGSVSYSLRGTLGQSSPRNSGSSSYQVNGGFWRPAAAPAPDGRIFHDSFEES